MSFARSNVYRGGPADRAGLKVGDVVTAINGREVADAGALRFRLATQPIGSTADLTVIRKGREITLQLPLAPAPETPPRQATKLRGDQPLQGATVVNLSPAVAEELGLDEWSGVVITEIAPGTFPLRLGLQPGDIIVKLNDKPIGSVAELKEALDKPVERWAITFKRAGQVRTLLVS